MARAVALLALLTLGSAGCGEKPEPSPSRRTAVTGTLNLARPDPGPPDGGTRTGHAPPSATASTTRPSLAITGRVDPATSRVTLRPAGGTAAAVPVGDDGTFRARARGLERGRNRFVLEARSAGVAPWRVTIAITRR